jgi:hypothetical protein
MLIAIVAWTKTCTVFCPQNKEIVGFNPVWCMGVCLRSFCDVFHADRGPQWADPTSREFYQTFINKIRKPGKWMYSYTSESEDYVSSMLSYEQDNLCDARLWICNSYSNVESSIHLAASSFSAANVTFLHTKFVFTKAVCSALDVISSWMSQTFITGIDRGVVARASHKADTANSSSRMSRMSRALIPFQLRNFMVQTLKRFSFISVRLVSINCKQL